MSNSALRFLFENKALGRIGSKRDRQKVTREHSMIETKRMEYDKE
jgi:hypothetical protein